jgi:hypothetical protein
MMKRILQIVAVLSVALLAAQPALAGLSCTMEAPTSMPCVPGCDMTAMSQMGMDCQMPLQIAGTGCFQDCCQRGLPQVVAQLASGAKPKAARTQLVLIVPQIAPALQRSFAATPPDAIVAAAPPRYILFRVFRI